MLKAPGSFPQSWRQNGGFRERIRSKRANGREFRAQSDCEPLGSSAGYGTSQSSLIWVAEEFKNQKCDSVHILDWIMAPPFLC